MILRHSLTRMVTFTGRVLSVNQLSSAPLMLHVVNGVPRAHETLSMFSRLKGDVSRSRSHSLPHPRPCSPSLFKHSAATWNTPSTSSSAQLQPFSRRFNSHVSLNLSTSHTVSPISDGYR